MLVIGIVVGVSYAWWTYTAVQESTNTISSDCLKLELTDENTITLNNAYPITDLEAKDLIPYSFTIKNVCNTTVEYDVNLEIMEISNRLKSEYIAVSFENKEKKMLNQYSEIEPTYNKENKKAVETRYFTSGELGVNESKSYSIKLWMDEHVTIEDDAMNKNFESKISVSAKQSHKVRLVDHIMSETSKNFEKFEHEATEQTPALTDYRYTGANPNNYVYFGCEEDCTEENLYRIIGVMPTQSEVDGKYENRVKLIKASNYEGSSEIQTGSSFTKSGKGYLWNTNASNAWENSTLKEILNNEYLNFLGEYQNFIVSAKWYLGAPTHNLYNAYTTEQLYVTERSNTNGYSGGAISYVAQVGLMYPSDYGFSIDKVINQSIYNNRDLYQQNSWLYQLNNKYYEWTITPEETYSKGESVWMVARDGALWTATITNEESIYGVRPVFFLKENVLYKNGNGTKENPYRIGLSE